MVQRLGDAALDFQEALSHANSQRGEARLAHLREADAHLTTLRLYLRLLGGSGCGGRHRKSMVWCAI